ncbi:MAG: hypothetical protein SGILL_005200, partial [Bacillariaceae sp.]
MAASLIGSIARIGLKGIAGATGVSGIATAYVYQTDESWRRIIDFHILTTPILWDYYRNYGDNSDDDEALQVLHEKHAPKTLDIVLDLGGYYVKAAQMFCGMNLMPKAYEKEFSILLDQVPPKHDFVTIKQIVETELGGKLNEIFLEFDEKPIAAASIGQVHCAKILQDGIPTDVVVKVQYPEVEKYFELDVLSLKNLCNVCQAVGMETGISPESLDKVFDEFTNSFQEEFDYRREAENMLLVGSNLRASQFAKQVKVPQPISPLTSAKVLTMEKLQGEPIQKRMNRVMSEWAEREGKTMDEFKEDLEQKYKDPKELEKIMQQKPPSALQLWFYKTFLRSTDLASNTKIWITNKFTKAPKPYNWSTLPLDASRICNLVFQVHAHQLFVNGAFNADPHAGNILICEDGNGTTTLGLIDFGNVQRIPSEERRKALAQFYLSMAKDWSETPETWNNNEIAKRFKAVGGESINSNTDFLTFNALTMYDMRLDPTTLKRFGIDADMSNYMDAYQDDTFKEFPADLVNLQRLCQTLVGVAGIIGAGQPSCAR